MVCEVQASAALALACKTHIKNPQTLKNVLMLLSVKSGDAPPHLSFCSGEVYVRKQCSPDWALGGKKSGWHICADWQGGEPERNVPTLKFREVALNVLPAGSTFEDVCVFVSRGSWYTLIFQFFLYLFQSKLLSWISEDPATDDLNIKWRKL